MLEACFWVAALGLYAFFETDIGKNDRESVAGLAGEGLKIFAAVVFLLVIRQGVLGAGLWTRSLDFLALPLFCVLRNPLKEDRVFSVTAAGFWIYLTSLEWAPARLGLTAWILAGGWAATRLVLIGLNRRLFFLDIPKVLGSAEEGNFRGEAVLLIGAGILWMAIEALFPPL